MSEFYFYAECNGVKWYKCKRCQAAARGAIPAGSVCPICKGQGKLLNSPELEAAAEKLKHLDEIAAHLFKSA
jgi:hypothetical protein